MSGQMSGWRPNGSGPYLCRGAYQQFKDSTVVSTCEKCFTIGLVQPRSFMYCWCCVRDAESGFYFTVDLVPDQKKINFHHWVGLLVHRGMVTSQLATSQPCHLFYIALHKTAITTRLILTAACLFHAGEDKDAGGEIVEIKDQVTQIWLLDGHRNVLFQKPDVTYLPKGDLSKAAAHW